MLGRSLTARTSQATAPQAALDLNLLEVVPVLESDGSALDRPG